MSVGSSLSGKRIVITRPRAQAAVLAEKLAALGAEPVLFPTIEIAPLDDIRSTARYRTQVSANLLEEFLVGLSPRSAAEGSAS